MNRITISQESECATSTHCFPVSGTKANKDKWIKNNDMFISDDGRVYALVDTLSHVYFMDAITGSLYQFCKCLSSDRLKAPSFRRDPVKAAMILNSAAKEL